MRVYFDDIVIFSHTPNRHIERTIVFLSLSKQFLKSSGWSSSFFTASTSYLDYAAHSAVLDVAKEEQRGYMGLQDSEKRREARLFFRCFHSIGRYFPKSAPITSLPMANLQKLHAKELRQLNDKRWTHCFLNIFNARPTLSVSNKD